MPTTQIDPVAEEWSVDNGEPTYIHIKSGPDGARLCGRTGKPHLCPNTLIPTITDYGPCPACGAPRCPECLAVARPRGLV